MASILVCGDRKWTDVDSIKKELALLPKGTLVVHGDYSGADKLADATAKKLGLPTLPMPTEWDNNGNQAGPIRNAKMLTEGQPILVLAFHPDLDASRGTRNMISQARAVGVPVKIITGPGRKAVLGKRYRYMGKLCPVCGAKARETHQKFQCHHCHTLVENANGD